MSASKEEAEAVEILRESSRKPVDKKWERITAFFYFFLQGGKRP